MEVILLMFIIKENFPVSHPIHDKLIAHASNIENLIRSSSIPSPEQTIALRKLQESIFYACLATKQQNELEEISINASPILSPSPIATIVNSKPIIPLHNSNRSRQRPITRAEAEARRSSGLPVMEPETSPGIDDITVDDSNISDEPSEGKDYFIADPGTICPDCQGTFASHPKDMNMEIKGFHPRIICSGDKVVVGP